jgi:hypothetical protein
LRTAARGVDTRRVTATAELACPRCGGTHAAAARACALCGEPLGLARPGGAPRSKLGPRATFRSTPEPEPQTAPSAAICEQTRAARREAWLHLGLGLVTAPLFVWVPFLALMAWFLAALAHEMGHTALAWLCGSPALPALSPGGHAATFHGPRSLLLALCVAGALGAALARALEGRVRTGVIAALGAFCLLCAVFEAPRELAHLLAGHGAELAFATLCLWKTLDGGFTDSRLERALYGTLGWTLLGKNLALCWGLVHSAGARSAYRSSGSFGLTNDYVRVAELTSLRLSTVGLVMLAAGLLVLPAAFALWRLSTRARSET